MFFAIKQSSTVSPVSGDLPHTSRSRSKIAPVARELGRTIAAKGSTQAIPNFPLKRLFKPIAWAKPVNAERWLNKVIDSAMRDLPTKVLDEMSKFPPIDHALAEQHGTTVFKLMSDYEHLAATHATYHLANAVNDAMNKDWGPAARQMADQKITAMAHKLILQKLDQTLNPKQLNSLTESTGNIARSGVQGAINQKEAFALSQLTDALVGHVLVESKLADDFSRFRETVMDEFKVSDNPYGRVAKEWADDANPYYQMLDELGHIRYSYNGPPDDKSSAGINRVLSNLSPTELKQVHLKLFSALENGLSNFHQAYDQFIKSDLPPYGESPTKVSELMKAAQGDATAGQSKEAGQWLEAQKNQFRSTVDEALHGLNSRTRGVLLATIVAPHLQKLGNTYTAQARNLPAIQSAVDCLDRSRAQVKQISGSSGGFSERKWMLQSAFVGVKNTLSKFDFSEVRQAYADNRSGYATKDTGMQRHIEQVAGPDMLKGVAPMHRKFVLSALADYGQGVTSFLRRKGVKVRTLEEGKGLSDRPQRSFEQVYSNYVQPSARRSTFYTRKQHAETLTSIPATSNMVSYESENLGLPHFDNRNNQVVMSRLFSSGGEYFAAHELGHAVDFALGQDQGRFFSPSNPSMMQEYRQNLRDQDGLTVYGQSHMLETFAESAAAFLNQHGSGSTHEPWAGHNDLFSRENLKDRQPVVESFLDEVIRNPDKPERAVWVAREQAKKSGLG